jgi:hypothetical protein
VKIKKQLVNIETELKEATPCKKNRHLLEKYVQAFQQSTREK